LLVDGELGGTGVQRHREQRLRDGIVQLPSQPRALAQHRSLDGTGREAGTVVGRNALMRARTLYLDLINLFFVMLRFLGDRR
jgi:FtsH-binding integral membrane protein